jgi:hypothetical protein
MEKDSNSQKLGGFAAIAMEALEQDYPDGVLGEIAMVMEIQSEDDQGQRQTTIRYICTDPRNYVQIGLLQAALLSAKER